jgi:nicotinamidase/pyrazinamidase
MRSKTDALLIIDLQNDFCDGGTLEVPDGTKIIEPINKLMMEFQTVILTQDWHGSDHSSFASQHPKKCPYMEIEMPYGPQMLWPDHCIKGSVGADFHSSVKVENSHLIIRKGFRKEIDSYSAFFENDKITPTGLLGYLSCRNIDNIFIVGLALDFCVRYSALDAARLGFNVTVLKEFCKSIDLSGSLKSALSEMKESGVKLHG